MTYRAAVKNINEAHRNAWYAVVGECAASLSWDQIDSAYEEKYNVKLIREPNSGPYEFIDFNSKSDYILFMLEWS